jgi:hypothetical protein
LMKSRGLELASRSWLGWLRNSRNAPGIESIGSLEYFKNSAYWWESVLH